MEQAWKVRHIDSDLRVLIASKLGVFYRQMGQLKRATTILTETLNEIHPDEQPLLQAQLLQHLGNITRQQGDTKRLRCI